MKIKNHTHDILYYDDYIILWWLVDYKINNKIIWQDFFINWYSLVVEAIQPLPSK